MILRKLELYEHGKTRKLWEAIFREDTKEFLDYYYEVKTTENEIYVIEEDGKIVSMLHLNPYQMRIREKIYLTNYIVAVATDEKYRKRGYMAKLLNYAIQVMRDRGEPFTFLMPAAEAIYKPFGFEFIYEQARGRIVGKQCDEDHLAFVMAKEEDCKAIAEYANSKLQMYDVVTWRNERYYKTLLKECASENGGILLVKENERIEGVFSFAKGKEIEIREPLCSSEQILQYAIFAITGNETEEVECIGFGEETRPMIMAKILQEGMEKELNGLNVFLNEVV